jgi:type VI secretion system protein ImpJ
MAHRVIWKEGTFILPQHFQQQERFTLSELHKNLSQAQPFYWGFQDLVIAESDLSFGQFSLLKCVGTMQDGTSFQSPQINKLPAPIKLEDGVTDATIYLVLPNLQANANELSSPEQENTVARIIPHESEIHDNTGSSNASASVLVGDLDYKLMVSTEDSPIPDGNMSLSIAKVKEVVSGKITLCDKFIPNIINVHASAKITRLLNELLGMLSARADSLSHQATDTGSTAGITGFSDFLLLLLINRVEPIFQQYTKLSFVHPFDLYKLLVSTAGELSTFMKADRRPINYPSYQHDKLALCFDTVMEDIDTSFKVVLEQIATQIELSKPKNNIRAARLSHKALLDNGVLILAVSADMTDERLRTEFPTQIKIGPGEKIFSLVQSAVPGIKVNLMTQVPPEIPYRSGYFYFELSKNDVLWDELQQSKGLAIHVSGNFPGLVIELWAINRK